MQSLGNKKPETMGKSQWEMLITSEFITDAHLLGLWSVAHLTRRGAVALHRKLAFRVLHRWGTLLLSLTWNN